MSGSSKAARLFSITLAVAALLGTAPTVFNYVVDPYDRNGVFDLDLDKFRVSERAHYPLWKMIHYPWGDAGTVILGDSRARALRAKLWWDAGVNDAYNFAYGGGSIPEVFATFEHIKSDPAIKTLIVGVQLRSFDPDHRAGVNRVPEAIRMSENPLAYYANWFVARMAWRNLEHRYPNVFENWQALLPRLASSAEAAERGHDEGMSLQELLAPAVCEGCAPRATPAPVSILPSQPSVGLGDWRRFWPRNGLERLLPERLARQVTKHGRGEWRKFDFSNRLWRQIEAIGRWSQVNDIELVFVIPPTITEMQAHIDTYGHTAINHDLRLRLAELGVVFDFDYDSPLSRDVETFTDAIHFTAPVARAMVGEIALYLARRRGEAPVAHRPLKRVLARRGLIICPSAPEERRDGHSDGVIDLDEGVNCRIWRASHGR